jgi:hypothetical protein
VEPFQQRGARRFPDDQFTAMFGQPTPGNHLDLLGNRDLEVHERRELEPFVDTGEMGQ